MTIAASATTVVNRGTIAGDIGLTATAAEGLIYDGLGGRLTGRIFGSAQGDRYRIDDAANRIVEAAAGGADTVETAAVAFALPDNVETLVLIGAARSGVGNAGANRLVATPHGAVLRGLAGDDTVEGGEGDDLIAGGAGDDTAAGGEGDDRRAGEEGNDSLDGGAGNDALDGGADADAITGGAGEDSALGGEGRDLTRGERGNDTVNGAAGDDALWGGAGDDLAYGRAGDDAVEGGAGNDRATAGMAMKC